MKNRVIGKVVIGNTMYIFTKTSMYTKKLKGAVK